MEQRLGPRATEVGASFLKFSFHTYSTPVVLATPNLYPELSPASPWECLRQVVNLIKDHGWKRRIFHGDWYPYRDEPATFVGASIDSSHYIKGKIAEAVHECNLSGISNPESVDNIVRRKLAEIEY